MTEMMRKTGVALIVGCLSLLGSLACANADQTEADIMAPLIDVPALAADEQAGTEQIRSADHLGKVVLVDFWASWCRPCREALPAYVQLREDIGAEQFEVIAVNVDRRPRDGLDFLEKHPVTYPVASDPEGDLARQFGVVAMPMSFLLDRQGRIRHRFEGYNNKHLPKLTAAVQALVQEERP